MITRKISSSTHIEPRFVAEQIGIPENEFKEQIVGLLQSRKGPLRSYLARVEYDGINDFDVALCIVSETGEDLELANDIGLVFRKMFDSHERLDIFFITRLQEGRLRKVCCPFFTSRRYDHPDFYLTSSENYNPQKFNACYKERRFLDAGQDDHMLCEIDPPIVGQSYGLPNQLIHRVVLTSRQADDSVFSINEQPNYVHVSRLTRDIPDDQFVIAQEGIEPIGWAVRWIPLSRQ
jgi:hypothetical protein